jgi:hypothetical protein
MKKTLATALVVLGVALSPLAQAEWSLFGELERFRWKEDISPSVTETGPMLGLGLRWRQDVPAALRFGYEARLYGGSVDYDGALLFSGTPVTGTTDYSGLRQELQALYRPGSATPWELLGAVGYDYWNRQLSADQSEEYRLAYIRLGAQFDRGAPTGWFGGGGIKYPFWIDEDGHFPDIGFAPNPHLTPKGEVSLYGELGYRFAPHWSLAGYYEGYRLGASEDVLVTDGSSDFAFFQPASRVDSFGLRLRYSF